jgi:hypothetical protein
MGMTKKSIFQRSPITGNRSFLKIILKPEWGAALEHGIGSFAEPEGKYKAYLFHLSLSSQF